jgi:NitT/TauT family transport system permease protein
VLGVLGLALAWEVAGHLIDPHRRLLFAPLSAALAALWQIGREGELWPNLLVTLRALTLGYALAVVVGLAVGAALARSRMLGGMFGPLVVAGYVTPLIAVTPLLVMVFGLGPASKIAVVFLLAVFPIALNTRSGLEGVDPDLLDTARAFRAGVLRTTISVVFPAAAPQVLTGLRLAAGRGVIAVIVAELFGSDRGLGFLLLSYGQAFQTPRLLGIVLVVMALGLIVNGAWRLLEAAADVRGRGA